MARFCRFELRTTDASAARAFYARLFGHDRALIWPLHEQALARGARPHWLGHLGGGELEQAIATLLERGAVRLGPVRPTSDGGETHILRDPGGALVALLTVPASSPACDVNVVWHVLNTNAAAQAAQNYCELFGWQLTQRFELAGQGAYQQFAWHTGGPSVGAIADIESRPGVHPHWLFFFEVDELEPAISTTRAAGGLALEPIVLPSGDRVCVCDDPQGAAFGLLERLGATGARTTPVAAR
jgi:uncharacterized protein